MLAQARIQQRTPAAIIAFGITLALCMAPALAIAKDTQPTSNKQPTQQLASTTTAPQPATPTANGFTVEKCTITAQIQTDASMRASVQNTLQLGKNCNAFYWSIAPLNGDSSTTINSVRMAYINQEGKLISDWVSLTNSFFDADLRQTLNALNPENATLSGSDTATLTNKPKWTYDTAEKRLYAFFPSENTTLLQGNKDAEVSSPENNPVQTSSTIILDIDYTVENAVMAYNDVGEIYWYYISGGNNMPIWNLSVVIKLPMPRSIEVQPGETVVAWGHGAAGTVDVQEDGTIHYDAPYVASRQYMMAHVLFPVSWLENMSRETRLLHSGLRKTYAIETEDTWTDIETAYKTNFLSVNAAFVILCVGGIVAALVVYFNRGRENKSFAGDLLAISGIPKKELREYLFTQTSPVVINRLLQRAHTVESDFTESLMYLIDIDAVTVSTDDAIRLDTSTFKGKNSAAAIQILQERNLASPLDYLRLHISKSAKDSKRKLAPTERETLKILFDDIADGYPALPLTEIKNYARTKPKRFTKLFKEWEAKAQEAITTANVFDTQSTKLQRSLLITAIVYVAIGIIGSFTTGSVFIAGSGIITALAIVAIAFKCSARTPKGVELALMAEVLESNAGTGEDTSAYSTDTAKTNFEDSRINCQAFPAIAFREMLEAALLEAYK